ncbi:MAG: hypothetical protein U1E27_13350, partial [Kiritimatiellia bacterium]|nr:hypothetical protein [Kiritimatiellia bacterium]
MENAFDLLVATLWATSLGLGAWILCRSFGKITYVTLADGRRAERRLPILYRMLLPLVPNLSRVTGAAFLADARADAQRRLISAGLEGALDAREFLALRGLLVFVAGPLGILLLRAALAPLPGGLGEVLRQRQWVFAILILLAAFVQPAGWL